MIDLAGRFAVAFGRGVPPNSPGTFDWFEAAVPDFIFDLLRIEFPGIEFFSNEIDIFVIQPTEYNFGTGVRKCRIINFRVFFP